MYKLSFNLLLNFKKTIKIYFFCFFFDKFFYLKNKKKKKKNLFRNYLF